MELGFYFVSARTNKRQYLLVTLLIVNSYFVDGMRTIGCSENGPVVVSLCFGELSPSSPRPFQTSQIRDVVYYLSLLTVPITKLFAWGKGDHPEWRTCRGWIQQRRKPPSHLEALTSGTVGNASLESTEPKQVYGVKLDFAF